MGAEDTPLVSDFGLGRRVDRTADQTVTDVRMGTPSDMSPEMAAAEHDIGPATDLYSLGAILYDILTGRPPFDGGRCSKPSGRSSPRTRSHRYG